MPGARQLPQREPLGHCLGTELRHQTALVPRRGGCPPPRTTKSNIENFIAQSQLLKKLKKGLKRQYIFFLIKI